MKPLKVKDHKKFTCFEYYSFDSPYFELGQVLYKYDIDNGHEIGVVIQTHDDGDCRTDMWGNCSPSEVRSASWGEISRYRSDLLADIYPESANNSGKYQAQGNMLYYNGLKWAVCMDAEIAQNLADTLNSMADILQIQKELQSLQLKLNSNGKEMDRNTGANNY